MAKKKTNARLLEQYLDKEEGHDAALDEGTRLLVDSLEQWRHDNRLQPRAGFAQELAQDLQDDFASARRPWFLWPALSRIVAGGVSVALLLLFAFFVSGLFRGPLAMPASGDQATPTSQRAMNGVSGLFAGVQFLLDAPLNEEAQELPAYVIDAAPLPQTDGEVLTMAVAIGMENPRIYRSQGALEGWMALDDAGRRLIVDENHVRFPIIYRGADATGEGVPAVPFTEASSLAVQFLERGGLLPGGYALRHQLPGHADGLTRVEIVPTLDDHPVHYTSSEVTIGPDGAVVEARVQPLTFRATGETMPVQPARVAFEKVLESHVTIDGRRQSQVRGMTVTYFPDFDAEQQGATVTLVGYVSTLLPAGEGAGQETIVELSAHPETLKAFRLTGAAASNTEDALFARVTGALRQQLPGGAWQVEVTAWQPLDVENAVQCKEGVLEQEQEEISFVTGEGERYILSYPPTAVTGEAAYVCAAFSDETETDTVAWLSITSPLTFQSQVFGSVSEASELERGLQQNDGFPETIMIDWITPGYVFSPALRNDLPGQRLAPAWLFYGQDPEGLSQFVLRVPVDGTLKGAHPGS